MLMSVVNVIMDIFLLLMGIVVSARIIVKNAKLVIYVRLVKEGFIFIKRTQNAFFAQEDAAIVMKAPASLAFQ
jgi:hypothetical protein